jgi:hypothetical protein
MQVLDIGTSQHLDTKLSFDDSPWLKGFAMHPYFEFWQELDGKATDADVPQAVYGPSPNSGSHPAPGSSYYFEVGIDPSYTFKEWAGLKLEAPCRVLLPNERFYGEYYADASTVGLFELGLERHCASQLHAAGLWPLEFSCRLSLDVFRRRQFVSPQRIQRPGQARA